MFYLREFKLYSNSFIYICDTLNSLKGIKIRNYSLFWILIVISNNFLKAY